MSHISIRDKSWGGNNKKDQGLSKGCEDKGEAREKHTENLTIK